MASLQQEPLAASRNLTPITIKNIIICITMCMRAATSAVNEGCSPYRGEKTPESVDKELSMTQQNTHSKSPQYVANKSS